MNETASETRPASGTAPQRRRGRIVVLSIVIVVLALLVVAALVPAVVSTSPVRREILSRVNAVGIGTVSIDAWSFGWLSGLRLEGVTFEEKSGSTFNVKRLAMSRGLLSLIGAKKSVGNIVVSEPRAVVRLPEKQVPVVEGREPESEGTGGKSPAGGGGETTTRPQAGEAGGPAQAGPLHLPFDLSGTVRVENGSIEIHAGSNTPQRIEGMNLTLAVPSLNAPCRFEFAAAQPESGGALKVEGTICPLHEGVLDTSTFQAECQAHVAQLDLSPIGMAASVFGPVPAIRGLLNIELNVSVKGVNTVAVKGMAGLKDLALSGGPLGSDTPSYDSIDLSFDVERQDKNIQLKTLAFQAPFARFEGSGKLADAGKTYPSGSLAVTGHVDLARLAADLPATLRMGKGISVTKGLLQARIGVESDGAAMNATADLQIPRIEARKGQERLLLDTPIRLSAKAAVTPAGPRLDTLSLSSSFAQASAKGDLKDLDASLDVDLAAALVEAGKFVDLKSFSASGKVAAHARVQATNDSARVATADVALSGLKVTGITPGPLTHESLKIQASARLVTGDSGAVESVHDARVSLEGQGISGTAGCRTVTPGARPEDTGIEGGTVAFTADIGILLDLCRTAGLLSRNQSGGGKVAMTAALAAAGGTVSIAPLRVHATDLFYGMDGRTVREPAVDLMTRATLDNTKGNLSVEALTLASAPFNLDVHGTVTDIRGLRQMTLGGTQECDFARIGALISVFAGRPFEMEGKQPDRIHLEASLIGPTLLDRVRTLRAEAGLHLASLKSFGMQLQKLDLQVKASDGKILTSLNTTVNGGTVAVAPQLNVSGVRPLLTVPPDSRVLDKVKLTDEMASELLGSIHPLFRGSSVLAGEVGLTLVACTVPLDSRMKQDMRVTGSLDLAETKLEPAGLLKSLLEVARLDSKAVTVPAQTISFVCKDGRLEPSPLVFQQDEYRMTLAGSVGLDGTVAYTASIPVTRKMVSKDVYEYVKDATLKVGIEGPVSSPTISRKAMDEMLSDLVMKAGGRAIEKQGDKLLKNLGDSLLKDINKKKP